MSRTKSQEFLEGNMIKEVKHSPKSIILILDNGTQLTIAAYATGWGVHSYGLGFKFEFEGV